MWSKKLSIKLSKVGNWTINELLSDMVCFLGKLSMPKKGQNLHLLVTMPSTRKWIEIKLTEVKLKPLGKLEWDFFWNGGSKWHGGMSFCLVSVDHWWNWPYRCLMICQFGKRFLDIFFCQDLKLFEAKELQILKNLVFLVDYVVKIS